jgi:hypothetical protein
MNVSKNQNHATSSRASFHSFLIDEEDFKQECRTFRNLFYAILARIQGHPVFHRPTSDTTGRPQEDPEFQLQISLKREGSTASLLNVTAIARHFRCRVGMVLYTKRVVIALMSLW